MGYIESSVKREMYFECLRKWLEKVLNKWFNEIVKIFGKKNKLILNLVNGKK